MATFTRVVESGGLSSAAKQLGVSSAAVSRRIAALEADLGTQLLARTTRRVVVTPAGLRYYERCLRIQRDVADAHSMSLGEAGDAILQVSAPVTFGMARVVPQMGSLIAKHPGLRVGLRLEDRAVDLVVDGVDVAIRMGGAMPNTGDIVGHTLCSLRRILVASPRYLKRRGTPATVEALAKHDALAHEFGDRGDAFALVSDRREVRVGVHAVFRTNTLHALRDLALLGIGLALLPDWFVKGRSCERQPLESCSPSGQPGTVVAECDPPSPSSEVPCGSESSSTTFALLRTPPRPLAAPTGARILCGRSQVDLV